MFHLVCVCAQVFIYLPYIPEQYQHMNTVYVRVTLQYAIRVKEKKLTKNVSVCFLLMNCPLRAEIMAGKLATSLDYNLLQPA